MPKQPAQPDGNAQTAKQPAPATKQPAPATAEKREAKSSWRTFKVTAGVRDIVEIHWVDADGYVYVDRMKAPPKSSRDARGHDHRV
jgi:hypothetical protein